MVFWIFLLYNGMGKLDGWVGGKALEALSMVAGLGIASYTGTEVCNYTNWDDERNHGIMG